SKILRSASIEVPIRTCLTLRACREPSTDLEYPSPAIERQRDVPFRTRLSTQRHLRCDLHLRAVGRHARSVDELLALGIAGVGEDAGSRIDGLQAPAASPHPTGRGRLILRRCPTQALALASSVRSAGSA